jgi:hypothetical protein
MMTRYEKSNVLIAVIVVIFCFRWFSCWCNDFWLMITQFRILFQQYRCFPVIFSQYTIDPLKIRVTKKTRMKTKQLSSSMVSHWENLKMHWRECLICGTERTSYNTQPTLSVFIVCISFKFSNWRLESAVLCASFHSSPTYIVLAL